MNTISDVSKELLLLELKMRCDESWEWFQLENPNDTSELHKWENEH